MSLIVACPECGKKFKVIDEKVGKNIKCSGCGTIFPAVTHGAAEAGDVDPWDQPAEEEASLPPALPPRLPPRSTTPKPRKPVVKERSHRSEGSSTLKTVLIVIGSFLGVTALGCGGCVLKLYLGLRDLGQASQQAPRDPKLKGMEALQEAANSAKPAERVYLDASKPVPSAIVERDYRSLYQTLSSHARASSNPLQYVTPLEEHPKPQADLKDLTVDQFVEWMKKMEGARGVPVKLNQVHIESTEPKILSGNVQGMDRLEAMMAIGAMPASIPANIRRASIRAQIGCKLSDEQAKLLAEHQKSTPKKVREDEEQDEDNDERYFNLKFVLVEEGGALKVGYFEFMPPSMLD